MRVVKEEGTSDDQHHHKVYGRSGSKEQRHCVLLREEDGTLDVSSIHHIMNLYKACLDTPNFWLSILPNKKDVWVPKKLL